MRQEDPLRDLARAASAGLRRGLLLLGCGDRKDARGSGLDRRGGLLRLRRADIEDVLDDVSAHARKEESAQERVDPDLAGPRDFSQKRHDARPQLPQVAGKLIGPGQVLQLAAARENVEPELRERVKKLVEAAADLRRGLLRIEPRTGGQSR